MDISHEIAKAKSDFLKIVLERTDPFIYPIANHGDELRRLITSLESNGESFKGATIRGQR